MIDPWLRRFQTVWAVDFEFRGPRGGVPEPLCLVARELRSGRELRLWGDELRTCSSPPYDIGPASTVVAHYASAEASCHLALGWKLPANVIDTFVEFRVATNGLPTPSGAALLGALAFFGLESMSVVEKEDMRALVLRGAPYSPNERQAILAYCGDDVRGVARLVPKLLPRMNVEQALLRGRFMCAAGAMEMRGVPVDAPMLARMMANWPAIKTKLIAAVNPAFGVYEDGSFSQARFEVWLGANRIVWPRLKSGKLALSDETWRAMVRGRPALQGSCSVIGSRADVRGKAALS